MKYMNFYKKLILIGLTLFITFSGVSVVAVFPKGKIQTQQELNEESDAQDLFDLGVKYRVGSDGFPQDEIQARKYLIMAVNKGVERAAFMLGVSYEKRSPVNFDLAFKYYSMAAVAGDHQAMSNLGNLLVKGRGVEKNESLGIYWLKKAASMKNVSAEERLKKLNISSYTVDEKEAAEFKEKVLKTSPLCKKCDESMGQSEMECMAEDSKVAEKEKKIGIDGYVSKHVKELRTKIDDEVKRLIGLGPSLQKEVLPKSEADVICENGIKYEIGDKVPLNVNKAVSLYEEAAKKGSVHAIYRLGLCYEKGLGKSTDANKAAEFYRQAMMLGDVQAISRLGYCYETGVGRKSDKEIALQFYLKALKKNDAFAIYRTSVYYEHGYVLRANKEKSQLLYNIAFKLEVPDVICDMGTYYMNEGYDNQAREMYNKAVELGSSEAMCLLGEHYEDCDDGENAVKFYKMAVNLNYYYAFYRLGLCYENGFGIARNLKKAGDLYQIAVRNNIAEAYTKIGEFFINGVFAKRNAKMAVDWFIRAKNCGDDFFALYNLGLCYENGIGVDRDVVKAVKYYKEAALNGCEKAMYKIFEYCEANQRPNDAKRWLKASAEKGYYKAQFEWGRMCLEAKDLSTAVKMFSSASNMGYSIARLYLGFCYEVGDGIEKDEQRAFQCYRLAADAGITQAQYYLCFCYKYGVGTEKSERLCNEASDKLNGFVRQSDDCARIRRFVYEHCNTLFDEGILCVRRKEFNKAVDLFTESSKYGNVNATYLLGQCYFYGCGVKKDRQKAEELFNSVRDRVYVDYNISDICNCIALREEKS